MSQRAVPETRPATVIVFAFGKLSLDFLHFKVLVLCLTGVNY